MLKKVIYLISALAFAFGVWGFYIRLFIGEKDVNYGSYVVWGLWVAMYLFFAGAAAGSYMIAALEYLFQIPLFKGTGKPALWCALICMPAALTTIAMDLGHWERVWKVYLSPNFLSLLAQMVWGYTLFVLIILASLYVTLKRPEAWFIKPLFAVGLFLAIFLSGGVGALLGVNASRAYWHIGLLPAQFPFFSLATGIALSMVVMGWFAPPDENRPRLLLSLGYLTNILILIKTYFLWSDYSQSLYSGIPQNVAAVEEVMFGEYWWAFWIFQIGLGAVIPLIVLSIPQWAKNGMVNGWMGLFVLLGFAAARANIVFPALTIEELGGLATAFSGPHLSFEYFPSLLEWSIIAGVSGGAALLIVFGLERWFFNLPKEVQQ